MNYHQYILDLKSGPIQYELGPGDYGLCGNIKMTNHDFPLSISPTEFDILKNLIIDYDLKNGYEVATAFGISTTALGLGFKETGGKLVSMDAYIEEEVNSFWRYQNTNPTLYYDMDGYKSAKYLIEHFNLKANVFLKVGWSPNDTKKCIHKHITEPLDFVFIDGGHFPDQFIKDLESIRPLLASEYIIVFHDNFPDLMTPKVQKYIHETFNIEPTIITRYPLGNNMSIINKNKIKNNIKTQNILENNMSIINKNKMENNTRTQYIQKYLTNDIRLLNQEDNDKDWLNIHPNPFEIVGNKEFSSCNQATLTEEFTKVKDQTKVIVEIGVSRISYNQTYDQTSTSVFLKHKNAETIYLGIDVDDKTSLQSLGRNIFTLQSKSEYYERVKAKLDALKISQIDFLFVDGWHSINQVIDELWYVDYMKSGGVIGFHDTNYHPGPSRIIKNLNSDIFEVVQFCEQRNDWGIGFAKIK